MNASESSPEEFSTSVPTELVTERLVLRPFVDSDCGPVEILLNDREIASNTMSIEYPYPEGDALKWISRHRVLWQNGDAFNFAIRMRSTDQLVGAIGIEINKNDHNGELGYWLGRPFWNRGYATEAAKSVIAFGFEAIGLHRITSHHLVRNPASGRVLEKIGMTKEGISRDHVRKWGVFENVVQYGMLARDPRP